MNRVAAQIAKMRELGIPADQILDVIEAGELVEPARSGAAIRQARYRQNKAENVTRDVTVSITRDDPPSPKEIPPTPPKEITPSPILASLGV